MRKPALSEKQLENLIGKDSTFQTYKQIIHTWAEPLYNHQGNYKHPNKTISYLTSLILSPVNETNTFVFSTILKYMIMNMSATNKEKKNGNLL